MSGARKAKTRFISIPRRTSQRRLHVRLPEASLEWLFSESKRLHVSANSIVSLAVWELMKYELEAK